MIKSSTVRKLIIEAAIASKEGHIASSFSIVEMLIAIYREMEKEGGFIPENLILSKGHASYAYYALLCAAGKMDQSEFVTIGKLGSKFYGHLPYIYGDKRFQFGSGSLGHGLPYAVGLRHAYKVRGQANSVYCIVGDGEANEGTFWESLLLVSKLNPGRLRILVDCNRSSERAVPIHSILSRLGGVIDGIEVHTCDGHEPSQINQIISGNLGNILLLCNTQKGYPVREMIGNPIWHHKTPNPSEAESINAQLL